MITVVVDTTATFVDVMLKSTRWMQLLTLSQGPTIDVVIPDVVLRETARHWAKDAADAIQLANGKVQGIKKSRDRLTALGIDGSGLIDSVPIVAVPNAAEFEKETKESLASLGVDVRPVPADVDIETVLTRDLARKKPFNSAGKGFRDTLVWETAKQVISESGAGDTVYFVTDNGTDYCDASGSLTSELLDELETTETITRVADLDELLKVAQIAPLVAGLAKSDAELASFLAYATVEDGPNVEPLSVGQVVTNAVLEGLANLTGQEVETTNLSTSGLDFTELNIPGQLEDVTIDVIEPDESTLVWQTYETYQDTTLLIQAEIHADVSLIGFTGKSDAIRP